MLGCLMSKCAGADGCVYIYDRLVYAINCNRSTSPKSKHTRIRTTIYSFWIKDTQSRGLWLRQGIDMHPTDGLWQLFRVRNGKTRRVKTTTVAIVVCAGAFCDHHLENDKNTTQNDIVPPLQPLRNCRLEPHMLMIRWWWHMGLQTYERTTDRPSVLYGCN